MKIHPYALIIGLVLGLMIVLALGGIKALPFALLMSVTAIIGFDLAFKANDRKKIDKDK